MEAVYTMEAKVNDDGKGIVCRIEAEGRLSEVGKAILLSKIMKALRINPDSVSDIALVSVALEHCQEEEPSDMRKYPVNLC